MKTYKNLYEDVCSFENLYGAYLKARKCKRYKEYVLDFSWDVEGEIMKLQDDLMNKAYKHGEYYQFTLYDAKKREIKAAPFRDRVVHHALCTVLEPIFDRGFIYDSYACRKGKGTHKAIRRLDKFIQSAEECWGEGNVYCLKCDISKYFDSIDHQVLFDLIRRKVRDVNVLWLVKKIIKSSFSHRVHYDLFNFRETGIPIGNLTSQLFANLYLDQLDQFVKHDLGEKYYIRYMDDFLILGNEKRRLHELEGILREFLRRELRLELHKKKVALYPVEKGISFLGYQVFRHYKLIRKSTILRFVKNMKEKTNSSPSGITDSVRSWLSFANYANIFSLRHQLFELLALDLLAI